VFTAQLHYFVLLFKMDENIDTEETHGMYWDDDIEKEVVERIE
jgi:hypothetical protein